MTTIDCLVDLIDEITKALDEVNYAISVFLDLDLLLRRINSELPAIYEWLCSHRLTLNLSKTKYLAFQPRQKVNSNLHPPLKIAHQYLEQSYNIK